MDYLKQTLLYLEEENTQLRAKLKKFERVFQNIRKANPTESAVYFCLEQQSQSVSQKALQNAIRCRADFNDCTPSKTLLTSPNNLSNDLSNVGFNCNQVDSLNCIIKQFLPINDQKEDQKSNWNCTKSSLKLSEMNNTGQIYNLGQNVVREVDQMLTQQNIKKVTRENSRLKQQVTRLYDQINTLETILQQKQLQISQVQKEAHSLRLSKEQLERLLKQEVENTKQFYQFLGREKEQQLQETVQEERKARTHQNSLFQEQLENLRVQLNEAKQINGHLSHQLNLKENQLEKLAGQNQWFAQQKKKISSEMRELRNQLDQLFQQKAQLDQKVFRLKEQLVEQKIFYENRNRQTNRQLLRERSLSKNALKNLQKQQRIFDSQVRKSRQDSLYHRKKSIELTQQLKTFDPSKSRQLSESFLRSFNQSASSIDLSGIYSPLSKTPPSFKPARKISYRVKREKNSTFQCSNKSEAQIKSNTISVIGNRRKSQNHHFEEISRQFAKIKVQSQKNIKTEKLLLLKQTNNHKKQKDKNKSTEWVKTGEKDEKGQEADFVFQKEMELLENYMRTSFDPRLRHFTKNQQNQKIKYEQSQKAVGKLEDAVTNTRKRQGKQLKFRNPSINVQEQILKLSELGQDKQNSYVLANTLFQESLMSKSKEKDLRQGKLRLNDLESSEFEKSIEKCKDFDAFPLEGNTSRGSQTQNNLSFQGRRDSHKKRIRLKMRG